MIVNPMQFGNNRPTHSEPMKTSLTLLTLCMCCFFHTSLNASPKWNISLYSFEDEVRATLTQDGAGKYTIIFGYGGCVSKLLDHDNAYTDKFAGPFNKEETDRVLQTVLWGISDNANIGENFPTRWNVNQAGTFENIHAEIVSFNLVKNSLLEVYSVNGNQWYGKLTEAYKGSKRVSQYTRYTCEADGVLSIRTITRVPRITVQGAQQDHFTAYIEHWSAFKNNTKSGGFNAVARRATAAGVPNWWYSTEHNDHSNGALPDYPNLPLSDPNQDGYVFAFNASDASSHMVAAMVFGKKQVTRKGSKLSGNAVINFKHWLLSTKNPGIGILPGIYAYDALPGTLIDFEYKLILRPASGPEFMQQVTHAVDQVITPRIYEPSEVVPDDLINIRKNLSKIIDNAWGGLPSKAYWEDKGVLHKRMGLFD